MLSWLQELWDTFSMGLMEVLPRSPFQDVFGNITFIDDDLMGFINWFVPFRPLAIMMGGWLGCIVTFYALSIVLRWVKVIGD